jgi:hypothetical protein
MTCVYCLAPLAAYVCAERDPEEEVADLCTVMDVRHAVEVLLLLAEHRNDDFSMDTVIELLFNLVPFIDFSL